MPKPYTLATFCGQVKGCASTLAGHWYEASTGLVGFSFGP